MKICILTTTYPAHAQHTKGVFIHTLARTLAQRNTVFVVCPYYKASLRNEETIDHVRITRYAYFFPRALQRLLENGTMYTNYTKSILGFIQVPLTLLAMTIRGLKMARHQDIYHAQWALAGIAGVIIKKLTRKPLIVTFRGSDLNHLENPILRLMIHTILRNADAITANNKIQYTTLRAFLPPEKPPFLIYNGIDTDRFTPRSQQSMRKKLHLPFHKTIILYVGWLEPHKGLPFLLPLTQNPLFRDLLFVFVGAGSMHSQIATLQKNHSNILLLGEIPHATIPYYLNAADLLILPSLAEGMPNIILEALASGTPVLSTAVGDVPEFVSHGKNGLLVPPNDPRALTNALQIALRKKNLTLYRKNTRTTLLHKGPSWQQTATVYTQIYTRILTNK